MIGEKHMFTSFEENDCPSDTIMFDDNNEGNVLGYGKIAITIDHSISKVLLVDYLDYNLLSVSQLCEMDYNYLFTNKGVTIFRRCDDFYAFSGILKGQLYLVDFNPEELELDKCLIAKTSISRRQASGSTTSCKKHHDNNKTIENATYGLVWSYCLY
jgi:hypothetical protein